MNGGAGNYSRNISAGMISHVTERQYLNKVLKWFFLQNEQYFRFRLNLALKVPREKLRANLVLSFRFSKSFAREHADTVFARAQLLRSWLEQRPSNQSDLVHRVSRGSWG
jgi:hypothetical protein